VTAHREASPRRTGPVVIGYDGSPAAERALAEAAAVLRPGPALVVVAWEAGRAYEAAQWQALTLDVPVPTIVDLRTAAELDQTAYASAERAAQQGAANALALGLPAEPLVVAEDADVAETLVRVAREQDAPALVIGRRHHGALSETLLGSTERSVLDSAPCPVLVVREDGERETPDREEIP
jgi:nucleotide-binding universal stress UspA family protein